ncbi:MAG: ABC transporter ATP-binding protein [Candidatus Kariarchaeaceae archaeon]|jgi:ATP-binding cassette subfamily B protein
MTEYSAMQIHKAVLKEASHEWKYYTIGILAMFAAVQANLTAPILIRLIIDEVIVGRDPTNLWVYLSAIVAIALLAGILNYFNRYYNDKGAEQTTFRLRNKLFGVIQSQSLKFLYEQESGQLMTRATADLNIIKQYLRRQFRLGLDAIYYFISIGIIIYLTEPVFLWVELILLPFLLVISWIYASRTRPLFKERREYFGKISNSIQENITAIETVRSFDQQDTEMERFEDENQEYLDLYLKAQIISGFTLPVALMLVSFGAVGVLFIGGLDIIGANRFGITLGMLVQFNLYMLQLVTPTRLLGNFITGFTQTHVSGQRVFETLWAENDIVDPVDGVMRDIDGKIRFSNVSFSYEAGEQILRDINLEVPENSTLAIFGSTGSGKSSLINLIPRFFDPTSGEVYIDDIDVRDYTLENLRRQIATVSQDIFLFSRSVKENIAFGRPEATEEEIIAAAKAAQAHTFIDQLPDGYDTVVGERGITLSGGQKQRLTIARAILINPHILILDDSTSSVDAETESDIQKALENLLESRTTLIITQRVSSSRFADQIIVLENGQITEKGTHDQLLQGGGIYSRIYATQKDHELEKELLMRGGTDE